MGVKFYLKFEDIEKKKYVMCDTLEDLIVGVLRQPDVKHSSIRSLYIGECLPDVAHVYILVEAPEGSTQTRRRGYVEVQPQQRSWMNRIQPFVPRAKNIARRIGREARDGLALEEALRRMSQRVVLWHSAPDQHATVAQIAQVQAQLERLDGLLPELREIMVNLVKWSDEVLWNEWGHDVTESPTGGDHTEPS